jgi:hypothetical protein
MTLRLGSGGSATELSVTGRCRDGAMIVSVWNHRYLGAVLFCSLLKSSVEADLLRWLQLTLASAYYSVVARYLRSPSMHEMRLGRLGRSATELVRGYRLREGDSLRSN